MPTDGRGRVVAADQRRHRGSQRSWRRPPSAPGAPRRPRPLWHELAAIADAEGEAGRPAVPSLYAVACHYAAILDQEAAAAVRFEHRIPTLFPRSEAGKLHLPACPSCGRPWQRATEGACPQCPRITFGPSPSSTAQAAQYPDPEPVPDVLPEVDADA